MSNLELNLDEIVGHTGGNLLTQLEKKATFTTFIYDSRTISPGCIFLCIKGERVDGHDFIEQAISKGARLIIGDQPQKLAAHAQNTNVHILAVESSLTALQHLATFYRTKFQIPVVGLTGSSGKTTTKDLMASIFRQGAPALITEGTLNNHWGVPQMVLRLEKTHQAAVFEMGMSDFGEIKTLSQICQPNLGFITTIGSAHLEKVKDENGVLKAKRELFDWISAHASCSQLLFNLDHPLLAGLHKEFTAHHRNKLTLLTLSQDSKLKADVRLTHAKPLGFEHHYGWEYAFSTPWGEVKGTLPLPGKHNLANAMAAAALALATHTVKPETVAQGLRQPQISKLRSHLFKHTSGAVIYDDSYNANPTSVAALFEAAKAIRAQPDSGISKTVAVVGDMLELGSESSKIHQEMGRRAAHQGVDVLLSTGAFAQDWAEGFAKETGRTASAHAFKSQDDLFKVLLDQIQTKAHETLILIKGSRGAKMDQIVSKLS